MSIESLLPWAPLSLLFLAPFLDPRHPFRLLHLDLLVLLGFSAIWLVALEHHVAGGWLLAGKLMIILGVLYLIARLLYEGRHLRQNREALVPIVSVKCLVVGLIVVLVFRAAYVLTDQVPVIDVGGAGVVGADLIADSRGIYEGAISREVGHGETYGPVNYLFYVPFEQAIPLEGDWHDADAARVAAICFDLAAAAALLVLGRKLRPGREGMALGVALAYAWATYPYTLFVLRFAFNDALMVALMLGALIMVAHPIRRGALLGLASATKFVPIAIAPLLVRGTRPWLMRSAVLFISAFAAVTIITFAPFMPDGGPTEIYDRTLGFQASGRCCSIWEQPPHLNLSWLEGPARLGAAALAIFVALRAPPASTRQLAARIGAVMAAVVLAAPIWVPSYAVWFVPFTLIGLFAADDEARPQARTALQEQSQPGKTR